MRHLLLLLALLDCSLALAQPTSVPAAPAASASLVLPAAPDTAAAIHRLFAGRRHRRDLIAAGLGVGVLTGAIAGGISEDKRDRSGGSSGYGSLGGAGLNFGAGGYFMLLAIPAVPLVAADLLVYARYSRAREAQALAAWQQHRLPARLRHKLKPRYFR